MGNFVEQAYISTLNFLIIHPFFFSGQLQIVLILFGVISFISLILLIFLLLKQLKNKTEHTYVNVIRRQDVTSSEEELQEATQVVNTEVVDSSSGGFEEGESPGNSIYDNFELYRR